MHILPLEIQHNIFIMDCTDGGRTGLALTLTSKAYRDAVRPVRLHSVAVRAFPHIDGVLQAYKRDLADLEASGSSLKPCIRHLLLSPEDVAYEYELVDESASAAVDDETYIGSVVALLQLVRPTLTTLAHTAQLRLQDLGGAWPRLEELTVHLGTRLKDLEEFFEPRENDTFVGTRQREVAAYFERSEEISEEDKTGPWTLGAAT
ncbi:hypothetical protein GSI_01293 [Ganoderma sinense ZZ0214-1]|uniref:F-box domain-containing protein n=1 Tax=Ganoderma sinense ZZ0214-1 TaxID=1077348 RepID=A0A2G8SV08_9APHY|nr:hypothetical protein GSI_01293 [Ganoderma sinense ZZ0214-1]